MQPLFVHDNKTLFYSYSCAYLYPQMELSKVGPQFSGSQQRDAQELLTFLLSALDSDLRQNPQDTEEEHHVRYPYSEIYLVN